MPKLSNAEVRTANRYAFAAALVFALWAAPACAQHSAHHEHAAMQATQASASTAAYQQAMAIMHARMNKPPSGNVDVDFVRGMIPHHEAAVAMAKIQLAHGRDEKLKNFARWVIMAQQIEIGFMKQWLRGHDNGKSCPQATDYYSKAMQQMHHAMMIDYTGDADVDFVRGMIPHHEGATAMASIVLAHGSNPEIRALASNIFGAQNYEIAWQRQWLADPAHASCFPPILSYEGSHG